MSGPLAAELRDLSDKQREVLDLVLDRRTNKEIAVALGISASAVEQRLQSVRRRLGVTSRADLARAYQSLVDACQNQTGEKLQVVPNSVSAQSYLQGAEVLPTVAGPAMVVSTGLVGARMPERGMRGHGFENGNDASSLIRWIDQAAGFPGRIAAVTVIATSLAFLLAIVGQAAHGN